MCKWGSHHKYWFVIHLDPSNCGSGWWARDFWSSWRRCPWNNDSDPDIWKSARQLAKRVLALHISLDCKSYSTWPSPMPRWRVSRWEASTGGTGALVGLWHLWPVKGGRQYATRSCIQLRWSKLDWFSTIGLRIEIHFFHEHWQILSQGSATKDYSFSRKGSRQDILEWRECLWSAENSHIEDYLRRGRGQDGTKKTWTGINWEWQDYRQQKIIVSAAKVADRTF